MTTAPSESGTAPRRPLGVLDVVLMTVVAVVSLRWIPRSARAGPPALLLWSLAWAGFLVPLATCVTRLASEHPDEAGPYAWTRKAFGPRHGFICGWCMWVNNIFYFPSVLLIAAANAATGPLAESTVYASAFVIAGLWGCVLVNVLGLRVGKWVQNVGSLGTWIPAVLVLAAGAVAWARSGSATPLETATLVPRSATLDTVSLWSSLCFAFSGIEVAAFVAHEVRDPARTVRRGILAAGVAITVIYIAGTAAVLVATPPETRNELSGIADAVDAVSARIELPHLGGLVRALVAAGAVAMTSSWFAAAATIPHATGHVSSPRLTLVLQGVASTAAFLVSLLFRVGGTTASVADTYDILVNLTIVICFVPYLYVFLAFLKLRPRSSLPLAVVAGGLGVLATLATLALVFVPPPGTKDTTSFLANIVLQTLGVLAAGGAVALISSRARRAPSR